MKWEEYWEKEISENDKAFISQKARAVLYRAFQRYLSFITIDGWHRNSWFKNYLDSLSLVSEEGPRLAVDGITEQEANMVWAVTKEYDNHRKQFVIFPDFLDTLVKTEWKPETDEEITKRVIEEFISKDNEENAHMMPACLLIDRLDKEER